MKKSLDGWRREIDAIDEKIVRLLIRRARSAVAIGKKKREQASPVRDSSREKEVLRHIRKVNKGPLSGKALTGIYRRIISACLKLQKKAED